ncbi:MAG: hypothetical protein L3J50_04385 [Emcibacter sp.]|nr:hypothetical protein [Emcibacter sp.]
MSDFEKKNLRDKDNAMPRIKPPRNVRIAPRGLPRLCLGLYPGPKRRDLINAPMGMPADCLSSQARSSKVSLSENGASLLP